MSDVAERRGWFEQGVRDGHDYMIVVTDTYDYEDYPIYVSAAELHKTVAQYDGKDMQRVTEVLDLKQPVHRLTLPGFVRDDLNTVVSVGDAISRTMAGVVAAMETRGRRPN